MTIFIRAVAEDDKAASIKLSVSNSCENTFLVDLSSFAELPGSPFAYWIGEEVRKIFSRFPCVEGGGRAVRVGLQTSDDFRFVRAHWEIDPAKRGSKWVPFAKGGELSPFYAPLNLVINWAGDGEELKAWAEHINPKSGWSRRLSSIDMYHKPGLTWPLRASRFAPQPLPSGCIFSVRGYSVFLPEEDLLPGLALFNSKPFDYLFKALLGRFGYPEFVVGILQKLPWAAPSASQSQILGSLAKKAWSAARTEDETVETSLAFTLPRPLHSRAAQFNADELSETQRAINAIAFDVFELGEQGRAEIDSASVFASAEAAAADDTGNVGMSDAEESDDDWVGLMSWCVGVSFGRFDVRIATGEREIPPEPEPFDPLPAMSPGMLQGYDVTSNIHSGLLVDDPGHKDDLTSLVGSVYKRIDESAPDDLRGFLARKFFSRHIRMYSKGSRKAPIYWQLSTVSASYSVWLYASGVSTDTLFRVQEEYVGPKLAHEQRKLEAIRAELGQAPSAAQRRAAEVQASLVEEIRVLLGEVKRVATLWKPELDDGIIINFAPLWRLTPHNRSWQNELKSTWGALQRGDYDWAHLAMHLWPERVIPKCAEDRSLAITHGLEEVFWFQDETGKWKPRRTLARPMEDIVRERTSDAVNAALKDLLDAAEPTGGVRRGRRKA